MIVLELDQATFFDCDDTLVMWHQSPEDLEKLGIKIDIYTVLPHNKHIEQLKAHKAAGHGVVVWSSGGWQWAQAVVKALQLEAYVDLVISKPTHVYDDLKINEFMPTPIWYKDEVSNED